MIPPTLFTGAKPSIYLDGNQCFAEASSHSVAYAASADSDLGHCQSTDVQWLTPVSETELRCVHRQSASSFTATESDVERIELGDSISKNSSPSGDQERRWYLIDRPAWPPFSPIPSRPPQPQLANQIRRLPLSDLPSNMVKVADIEVPPVVASLGLFSLTGPHAQLFQLIGTELFFDGSLFESKGDSLQSVDVSILFDDQRYHSYATSGKISARQTACQSELFTHQFFTPGKSTSSLIVCPPVPPTPVMTIHANFVV